MFNDGNLNSILSLLFIEPPLKFNQFTKPQQLLLEVTVINVFAHSLATVVTPVDGEVVGDTAATSNGKRQDEHTHLSATIQRSRDQVVVLDEQGWMVLPEPPLGANAKGEEDSDGGVDTGDKPSHVPEDNSQVGVAEELDLGVTVDDVERHRHDETNQVRDRHPLVSGADGEHVTSDTPRDGKSIVTLDVCSRPDVASLN